MTKEEKKKLADKLYREANKDKAKAWREANKEHLKAKAKEWREKNKEYKSKKDKEYKLKNAERIKKQNKEYNQKNKSKHNLYRSNRRKTDPIFRLSINARNLIRLTIKRGGYNKTSKAANLLGCTYEELKLHLESKFEPWMNWGNYGLYDNIQFNYGWDLDHIKPLSSANSIEELHKLFHYTNLQPLCSKVNRDIKKALI